MDRFGMNKGTNWFSPDFPSSGSEIWEHTGMYIPPSSGNTALTGRPPCPVLPGTGNPPNSVVDFHTSTVELHR